MGRFNEKTLIIVTIVAAVLLTAGFGVLTWLDWQAVYANEITESDPHAASVTEPDDWSERRKIQEIKREM